MTELVVLKGRDLILGVILSEAGQRIGIKCSRLLRNKLGDIAPDLGDLSHGVVSRCRGIAFGVDMQYPAIGGIKPEVPDIAQRIGDANGIAECVVFGCSGRGF